MYGSTGSCTTDIAYLRSCVEMGVLWATNATAAHSAVLIGSPTADRGAKSEIQNRKSRSLVPDSNSAETGLSDQTSMSSHVSPSVLVESLGPVPLMPPVL